jgi:flagellin-like hook-associated protein FlgL
MHPAGYPFEMSLSATEIFDERQEGDFRQPSQRNVLHAVNRISVARAIPHANFATKADHERYLRESLDLVKFAGEHLSRKAGFYGGVMNRIIDGIDYANQLQLQLKTEMKALRDADIVEAIAELQQGQFHVDTAFQARSAVQRRSLFDFLA